MILNGYTSFPAKSFLLQFLLSSHEHKTFFHLGDTAYSRLIESLCIWFSHCFLVFRIGFRVSVLPWSSPNSPTRLWGGPSADTSTGASLASACVYLPRLPYSMIHSFRSGTMSNTSLNTYGPVHRKWLTTCGMEGSEKNGSDVSRQHSDTTPGTSQQGQSTGFAFPGAESSVALNIIHCLVYFPHPQSRAGPCPERLVSHL